MTKDELIATITQYFNEHIPFNKLVGIQVVEVNKDEVTLQCKMKPELIGNTLQKILHGGVTATMLDVAGGLVALIHTIDRITDADPKEIQRKLRKIGTIDMRVDYLRGGRGEVFTAKAEVIRHGQKIAVTRMHLVNDRNQDIAVGTATYIVG
ncbi:thioesterase family protein [Hahella sp. CCB-MM4]|uniref:thioesterase family protein n=1 Tax=Hahella sp. (strain CCB-MM4) TaxID=1926491 RepID=UPI000B9B4052|nr:thioesterase family protein [Hahella sp. CCB-MM4]